MILTDRENIILSAVLKRHYSYATLSPILGLSLPRIRQLFMNGTQKIYDYYLYDLGMAFKVHPATLVDHYINIIAKRGLNYVKP